MKTLNLSKLTFVIALLLGLAAAWCVATPTSKIDESSFGGWIIGGGCCTGAHYETCQNSPYGCEGGITLVCETNPSGEDMCTPQLTNQCTGSNKACTDGRDTTCE